MRLTRREIGHVTPLHLPQMISSESHLVPGVSCGHGKMPGFFSCKSGWWFGTCFIFPCIGDNHPNWLIFFRVVETTNQKSLLDRRVCLGGSECHASRATRAGGGTQSAARATVATGSGCVWKWGRSINGHFHRESGDNVGIAIINHPVLVMRGMVLLLLYPH